MIGNGSDLTNMIADFIRKHGPYEPEVLDVGGYDGPYAELFPSPYYILDNHIGEWWGNSQHKINIKGWVEHGVLTGLADERMFNTIVSTEALEHFDDPIRAFRNMSSHLLPGGKLIITSPAAWGYHPSPKDCWRVQTDGWHYMCESSGIRLVELFQQEVGTGATVGFMSGIKDG